MNRNGIVKNKTRLISIAAILCLLGLATLLLFRQQEPDSPKGTSDKARESGKHSANFAQTRSGRDGAKESGSPTSARPDAANEAPARTKRTDRAKPDFSIANKTTVDMSPPAEEETPWPAGPRLYAEAISANKRFLNIRPNNLGMMPRLRVGPREAMQVTLTLPENTVGDRIHVELSDGGAFLDTEAIGRVYTLGKDRRISIPIETSQYRWQLHTPYPADWAYPHPATLGRSSARACDR